MKQEKWYIWDKIPGERLGVLPISRLKEHAETFVATFDGSLQDCIKYCEHLEATGYSVTPLDEDGSTESEQSSGTKENDVIEPLSFLLPIEDWSAADAPAENKKSHIRTAPKLKRQVVKEAKDEPVEELEGQMSLFELI